MSATTDTTRLAEALLAMWKREWEEESASLPASVDPEFLSPVTDTSHGELALEYAAALMPTVDAIADERVREAKAEVWSLAASWVGPPFAQEFRDRAAVLRATS